MTAVWLFLLAATGDGGAGVPYPDGFRRWAHVKSAVVGPEAPGAGRFTGLHHIYANELALTGYRTGRFPDGAVLVFDLFEVRTDKGTTEAGPRKFTDVMRKDSRGFAARGGWGFEEFQGGTRERILTPASAAQCFACHERRSSTDSVFSAWQE